VHPVVRFSLTRCANSAEIPFLAALFRANEHSVSNDIEKPVVKITDMKTKNLFIATVVSAGLTFGVTAQAKEEKHEEQTINSSDVPAAVQSAAQTQAQGGTIVRWEKEGANFEAVIEKNGKEWGYKFDANGRMLAKHNESKEKGEKY
jgi:plastocyanin